MGGGGGGGGIDTQKQHGAELIVERKLREQKNTWSSNEKLTKDRH